MPLTPTRHGTGVRGPTFLLGTPFLIVRGRAVHAPTPVTSDHPGALIGPCTATGGSWPPRSSWWPWRSRWGWAVVDVGDEALAVAVTDSADVKPTPIENPVPAPETVPPPRNGHARDQPAARVYAARMREYVAEGSITNPAMRDTIANDHSLFAMADYICGRVDWSHWSDARIITELQTDHGVASNQAELIVYEAETFCPYVGR